jgi:ribonucleoside-diphosphate reductase alpha chain
MQEGRAMAARIAQSMRDAAYLASVELAREKGAFPKFEAEPYLAAGTFASRLPEPIKKAIRKHGIRNSHLLSIAPTGTVSLAFADNASNGIEPPFSWMYKRKKREADGSTSGTRSRTTPARYQNSAATSTLPDYFVSALDMCRQPHCHDGQCSPLCTRPFPRHEHPGRLPLR